MIREILEILGNHYIMLCQTAYFSCVGKLILVADNDRLVCLWNEGHKHLNLRFLNAISENDSVPIFSKVKRWLDRYFANRRPKVECAWFAPHGTPFQQMVWKLLLEIPYGTTTTYGAIASRIAHLKGLPHFSARAVGGAVGRNPISILIPCHRVVGADGSLTGYGGGLAMKTALLEIEGIDMTN